MKKRVLVFAGCLALALASCGGKQTAPSTSTTVNQGGIEFPKDNPSSNSNTLPVAKETTNPISQKSDAPNNLVVGGSFSQPKGLLKGNNWYGLGTWGLYALEGGKNTFRINEERGELDVYTTTFGRSEYSTQVIHKNISMEKGEKYHIEFDMYAEFDQTGQVCVQQDYGSYSAYFKENFSITEAVQHYSFDFEADDDDVSCSFVFNLGSFVQDNALEYNIVHIDNVVLSGGSGASGIVDAKNVMVNQVGYLPSQKKTAIFRGETVDSSYEIINAATNEVVYTGSISEAKLDKVSGDLCGVADFTSFQEPGTYRIRSEANGESYTFTIGNSVYDSILKDSTRMLYLQRCGCKVEDDDFGHEACHTSKALVYGTNTYLDVSGGWHDAGDYGKYVVPGAKAVEDLLLTYTMFTDIDYSSDTVMKKSGGSLLEEAAYELDWMLKMQNSKGEVYHKVTTEAFPSLEVLPEQDKGKLVISPVSYAATADFAAVMAHASEVYMEYDVSRSILYREAAIKAYSALESMDKVSYQNPESITTGEYPDANLNDELLWASIELYKLTKEEKYLDTFKSHFEETDDIGFGWDNMIGYAYSSYCKVFTSNTLKNMIMSCMCQQASTYKGNINHSVYGSCFDDLYCWGSNMTQCNAAMLFLLLEDLGEKSYASFVGNLIDYLLGVNTTTYCFVSKEGEFSPENPHHRVCISTGKAIPGMLVGGPNNDYDNNGGDSIALIMLQAKGASAPHAYVDHKDSFSTNEVTIYWNSPLIFVLAGFVSKA